MSKTIEEKMNYSVLMSVYFKEKPEYLRQSMESIYNQTVKTNDFVLICDGPLNEGLDQIISEMQTIFGESLNVVRLEKNGGLGNALRLGIKKCKNEIILRQDSDDISKENRAKEQLDLFCKNADLAITSSYVEEFCDNKNSIIAIKKVPINYEEIKKYSRKRNPFNHPSVAFRKKDILAVGNYDESYHLFEDYDLWIKLLKNNYEAINTEEAFVCMRVPSNFYQRRGGIKYAKDLLRFHNHLRKSKWSSDLDFLFGAIPHAIICVMPNWFRKIIYKGLRK